MSGERSTHEPLKEVSHNVNKPNNRVSFSNVRSVQQYDVNQGKLRDGPKNEHINSSSGKAKSKEAPKLKASFGAQSSKAPKSETSTNTDEFFCELKRKSQSIEAKPEQMINNEIASYARSPHNQKTHVDSLVGFLSFEEDEMREKIDAETPSMHKIFLGHTEQKSFIPMRDNTIQEDKSQILPFKSETPSHAFPQSATKDHCKTLRKGVTLTQAFTFNGSICSNGDEMDFIQEENIQISPAKISEELNQTVEMANDYDEQVHSPGHNYLAKSKLMDNEADSLHSMNNLSICSESTTIKLGESAAKLKELEDMVANRQTIGFKQILAEAKLNRTLANEAPLEVKSSNCPPLKQARYKVNESPRNTSIAIPTALGRTPILNVSKCQQSKPFNNLQALSATLTPRRQASHAEIGMSTPARGYPTTMPDSDPMCHPVPLKSLKYIKWAQELSHDPNWLDEVRMPQWTPLAQNYFDLHGPTAGLEKDELRQKAERMIVQAINKFEGKMDLVRKYVFLKGTRQIEQIKPFKDKMLELKEKHDKLIEHHNKQVDRYNHSIEVAREKRHAENEEFITEMKNKIQAVISGWATS